ncbi:MAG: vitamin K epoxide reductase family protein [Chloroflexota bacterium]
MKFTSRLLFLLLCLFSTAFTVLPSSKTEKAVVHAAIFYSPACGHCHYVIEQVFPPLLAYYGDQLQIIGIDVSTSDGFALFQATWTYFGLKEGSGVPFLIIGDQFLIGSVDIPEQFPGLIDKYLAQGGVDLPPIPGLSGSAQNLLIIVTPTAQQNGDGSTGTSGTSNPEILVTPTPGVLITPAEKLYLGERIARDPLGNSIAIIILCAMILAFGIAIVQFKKSNVIKPKHFSAWLFPLLCLLGLGVAGYLAYVESAQVQAVCGPVGDCNTVQQSEYARLFGVLPIGVLGMTGFIAILVTTMIQRTSSGRQSAYAALAILAMTTFGVLFSIYLTFLEPFVIGATCAWCLTSAIIMTILFWLSLGPGQAGVSVLKSHKKQIRRIKRRKRRF